MQPSISWVMAIAFLLLWPPAVSNSLTTPAPQDASANRTSSALLNYTWYYDQYKSWPVGVTSSAEAELTRLRSLYAFNVFTTSPASGYPAYEWGYFLFYPPAIIYSDLGYYAASSSDSAASRH